MITLLQQEALVNEVIEKEKIKIEDMIFEIRGVQVILDSDLAYLYKCVNGTKDINKAVKRNIERFPNDFMFQLNDLEYNSLKFQFGTSKRKGGRRYNPYCFTEYGVVALASILHSDIAINISIKITRAFVAMKKYISSNLIEQKYINNMVLKHDNEIKLLQESFDKMNENIKNNHLFYDGQVYDAYSLMLDIFNTSKESIIIMDNYLDKNLLDILSKTKKEVLVVTNKYNNSDYEKYKIEYANVTLKIMNKIHDRFIIIDNKTLYHCGASFKDLGTKCFAISKIFFLIKT
jgi:hypothetical protein